MSTEPTFCLVCGSERVSEFLELVGIPVDCSIFHKSSGEARRVAAADIRLAHCRDCDHVFNAAFRPGIVTYEEGYDNSLSYSPRFRRYARELAESLVRRFGLHGKRLVEIGCGNGEFLRELCRLGGNTGTGYDPSYVAPDGTETHGIRIMRDVFDERHADQPADFVSCRHVLEHIANPRPFAGLVRRSGADVYFEVPDVRFTLADGAIWDIIYPHVSYYSPRSLAKLFASAGFRVESVASAFEGQFLGLVASARPDAVAGPEPEQGLDMAEAVAGFARLYRDTVDYWTRELARQTSQGRKVVVWGGGAKCVSFLNALDGAAKVEYVVDLSPRKQGLYVPGTGARVVDPDFLVSYRPDVVVVANPIYRTEIERMLLLKDVRPRSVVCLSEDEQIAA